MLGDRGSSTEAHLTGFGPIGDVRISGFQQANLLLGQNSDSLVLDYAISTLAVKRGDEPGAMTRSRSRRSATGWAPPTQINGGTGQSTVKVLIPGPTSDSRAWSTSRTCTSRAWRT